MENPRRIDIFLLNANNIIGNKSADYSKLYL